MGSIGCTLRTAPTSTAQRMSGRVDVGKKTACFFTRSTLHVKYVRKTIRSIFKTSSSQRLNCLQVSCPNNIIRPTPRPSSLTNDLSINGSLQKVLSYWVKMPNTPKIQIHYPTDQTLDLKEALLASLTTFPPLNSRAKTQLNAHQNGRAACLTKT